MTTLFFDLDGTLLNTQSGIGSSIQAALAELGRDAVSDEELRKCFGPPLRHSFRWMLESDDTALIAEAVAKFRRHYLSQGIYTYEIYPGITELLAQLSAKQVEVRVLTAKPQSQAELLLEHSDLARFFNAIHGAEDSGVKSEKTTHLRSLLEAGDYASQYCWMIGDRAGDVLAAKANGVGAITVQWGYGDVLELSQSGRDHHIESPDEILRLLAL